MVVTIHLGLPQVNSLKEKRRIIKSLLARLRNDFNVSIAEISDNDVHRMATLGAATIANSGTFAHQIMSKLIDKIERDHSVVLGEYHMETY
jgi:uncharacterized protein YlxP (DUF503 family)